MIQANELRIGNWLYLNFGVPVQVVGLQRLDSQNIPVVSDKEKEFIVTFNTLTAIEINPVNLLKCGFALGDGYYWKTWGTNGVFIVKFDTVYNKFFVEAGKGFYLLVEYVHELQNAFYVFSLGRELEIVW